MIIVTGGAGFIGSCIVRMLNDRGVKDIVIVDHIASSDKWMNIRNKQYLEYINRDDFLCQLDRFKGKVSHVIHMGACSATTERNFDFLYTAVQNNYRPKANCNCMKSVNCCSGGGTVVPFIQSCIDLL